MHSNKNSGFSTLELMVAVAIMVILMGLSMIGVARHKDRLEITELDNAAREIFMAAENRAALLSGAHRLNALVNPASTDPTSTDRMGHKTQLRNVNGLHNNEDVDQYCYYVTKTEVKDGMMDGGTRLTGKLELLTFGAVDPSLMEDNVDFYIVYNLESGSVTDVFYAKDNDGKESMSDLVTSYGDFVEFYKDWAVNTSVRLNDAHKSRKLVGWYNSEAAVGKSGDAGFTPPAPEDPPEIIVTVNNGEVLTVTVDYRPASAELETLTLTGDLGGSIGLSHDDDRASGAASAYFPGGYSYTWVLDCLEVNHGEEGDWTLSGLGAGKNNEYTWSVEGNEEWTFKKLAEGTGFKPGDDFTVEAAVTLDGSTYSAEPKEGNSLFAEVNEETNTASINYLRHLQNLSKEGGYESGLSVPVEAAIQTAAVYGYGYGHIYDGYKFVPIKSLNDTALGSYDGQKHEIRDLTLANATDAGLFNTTTSGMKLYNIWLVNTELSTGGSSARVGALVGRAYSAEIDGCRVYWEGPDLKEVLGTESSYKYKLRGTNAGGLVGTVGSADVTPDGPTVIKNSFAATTLSGSSAAGGLVGTVYSGQTVEIYNSYADCYLKGNETTAGLVGKVAGTANLADCYAAGFMIVKDADKVAGLSVTTTGGSTTLSSVYSAMLYRLSTSTSGKYNSPSTLTGNSQSFDDDNVYFMGFGTIQGAEGKSADDMKDPDTFDMTEGTGAWSSFAWMPVDGTDSHPYELNSDLPDYYVYPGVKDDTGEVLPHYGDWGEPENEIIVEPLALVYYERYSDNTSVESWGYYPTDSGVSGLTLSALKDDKHLTVDYDGYALIFTPNGEISDETRVSVNYKYGGENRTATASSNGEGAGINGKWVKIDDDYYMICLDNLNAESVPENFYETLTIQTAPGTSEEYYINPHFAKMLYTDDPGSVPETIEIRSARNLNNLGKHVEYYHPEDIPLGYTFEQSMNVDFSVHSAYAGAALAQTPIGTGTNKNSFLGYYNGCTYTNSDGDTVTHTIKGLNINRNTSYAGLFGYIARESIVENVTVYGSVNGTSNVGGIVGYSDGGEVKYCSNFANVTGSNQYVAGVVGYNNNGTVFRCSNHVWILYTGENVNAIVGGIVGRGTNGEVSECYNIGSVTAENGGSVGGIMGSWGNNAAEGSYIKDCYNTGTIRGKENVCGILGYTSDGKDAEIKNCYNIGVIELTGTDTSKKDPIARVQNGGIVITNCYYLAPASGTGTDKIAKSAEDFGYWNTFNSWEFLEAKGDVWVMCEDTKLDTSNNPNGLPKYRPGLIHNLEEGLVPITLSKPEIVEPSYYIYNEADLIALRTEVNNGTLDPDEVICLMESFELTGYWGGEPIGSSGHPFKNVFIGGDHTISGLNISDAGEDYQGLFGYNTGEIWNLGVKGTIDTTSSDYVGGVVGYNMGTVLNCEFTGLKVAGNAYVGGVVGYNGAAGTVSNSYNTGNVSGATVGGVVGDNAGSVSNCYNTGAVTETGGEMTGGVVGNNTGSVSNCYNIGNMIGANRGGVAGNNDGELINCYYLDGTAGRGIGDDNDVDNTTCVGSISGLTVANLGSDTWIMPHTAVGYRSDQIYPIVMDNPEFTYEIPGSTDLDYKYYIPDLDGLVWFRNRVNESGRYRYNSVELRGDIDLGGNEWTPIGNGGGANVTPNSAVYMGTFDGGFYITNDGGERLCVSNHTVSGIYINTTAYNKGLFGSLETNIQNGVTYRGTVRNVGVKGYVKGSVNVGGVVGWNVSGIVSNCYSYAQVTSTGNAGGVVGHNGHYTGSNFKQGTVENCYNAGSVTNTSSGASVQNRIGGVVGWTQCGDVVNCYNIGKMSTVISGTNNYSGGLAGAVLQGSLNNSYNTGSVPIAKGSTRYGGVAGQVNESQSGVAEHDYFLFAEDLKGIGDGALIISNPTAVSAEDLASGNVAKELQDWLGASAPTIWVQGTTRPVLKGVGGEFNRWDGKSIPFQVP